MLFVDLIPIEDKHLCVLHRCLFCVKHKRKPPETLLRKTKVCCWGQIILIYLSLASFIKLFLTLSWDQFKLWFPVHGLHPRKFLPQQPSVLQALLCTIILFSDTVPLKYSLVTAHYVLLESIYLIFRYT